MLHKDFSVLLRQLFELLIGNDDAMTITPRASKNSQTQSTRPSVRQLIQKESEIGGMLFGELPQGRRREFFNLDRDTWIWHEEWKDQAGKHRSATTRYEIHDNGILKAQEGARYTFLEGEELENFMISTRLYYERVARDIYHRDPATGRPLTVHSVA
ncbi:MAG: hypothetical protein WAS27_00420 [Candidatus Saccharimonadales bacterium]